ncbi:hypothetical protein CVIRNUC_005520 [Coccomyxa viridis]|uniref:Extracellular protein n=1 Tax=Coccomyxa viridis TaxID=1274662 RepID=A0AAV1I4N5_9CHLO|nr:hypothetical protein CVIRNUC_005520 [Coccomyxa viridis]
MRQESRLKTAACLLLLLLVRPSSCQFIFNPTIPGNAIIGVPGVALPSQAFLDQQALAISESLLAKNGGDPVKAFQEGQILFNSSAIYASGMAAHHGNTSAISSLLAAVQNNEIANVTFQIGTAIANMLPNRIGLDKLQFNYTQSVLGLITAATGINYEPCIISAGAAGAVLAATAIGISPRIFNTGPLGAGIIAEAISINPALLYIAPSAAPNVAVGYSVTPALITIAPTQLLQANVGESIAPYGISIGLAPPPAGPAAPGPAPAQAPNQAPPAAAPAQPAPDAGLPGAAQPGSLAAGESG